MPVRVKEITIAHSPDSDDAFMFYALAHNKLDTRGLKIHQVMKDIQSLNQIALNGQYEVSAISFAVYPEIADQYALMPCGSSMGDKYGPILVAKKNMSDGELRASIIAIPGRQTTAWLALQLFQPGLNVIVMPFDKILDAVANGEVNAGLLIHEGQLTYQSLGLQKVVDLGQWWHDVTNLPLPLGGNVVRKDLGAEMIKDATELFKASVEYSLAHREEALAYAMTFAKDMPRDLADKYVGMYVNERSVDFGEEGREALATLFRMGYEQGIYKDPVKVEFAEQHIYSTQSS
jgi:1,4-dihydroxy-6-naphthoate synthase